MQDWQTLINLGAGTLLTVMGWFARQLWDAVQELRRDLADLKIKIATDYTPKEDFSAFAREMRGMFQTIIDKLEKKVDK
jgi:hypothetical protein